MVKVKLLVQVEDNQPNCIGEGSLDVHTVEDSQRELAGLFRQAADLIEREGVGRGLAGDSLR